MGERLCLKIKFLAEPGCPGGWWRARGHEHRRHSRKMLELYVRPYLICYLLYLRARIRRYAWPCMYSVCTLELVSPSQEGCGAREPALAATCHRCVSVYVRTLCNVSKSRLDSQRKAARRHLPAAVLQPTVIKPGPAGVGSMRSWFQLRLDVSWPIHRRHVADRFPTVDEV